MKPLAQLVRPNILALQPYSTARDEYAGGGIGVWLDANESPYDNGVNRYPDPHQRELKAQLAALKGVRSGQIFLGNGSDEAIDLAFRIFCEPGRDNAVSIAPTYGMYRVAAQTNDVELREVPLGADFSLPVEALLAAADGRTKLLWLCSPNNPTGNAFPDREIEELLRRFDGVVVLDEAYIDFAEGRGFLPRIDEFPNLIVLQTLSKAWGMAGLRLGNYHIGFGVICQGDFSQYLHIFLTFQKMVLICFCTYLNYVKISLNILMLNIKNQKNIFISFPTVKES